MTSRPSPDDLLTYEVSVVRTTRQTFVVEAIDDDQAYDCYLSGDYVDSYEDELCSHYESTTLQEDGDPVALDRHGVAELLSGTFKCGAAAAE